MDRYTRELVLASHGEAEHRDLFLRRYDKYLGGIFGWMASLPESVQDQVFFDALRCQQGSWPQSLMGQRLALPRWFRPRVEDPWHSWRALKDYRPEAVALDPICLMLVDPGSVQYSSSAKGTAAYFCCPVCKDAYEGGPSPAGLAEVA
jgi:YHS domain-containing protein